MTMIGLHVSSDLSSLDDEGETKVVSINGLACLWLTKVADDHIGLCVSSGLPSLDDEGETKVVSINGLACLWLTKARMTMIGP